MIAIGQQLGLAFQALAAEVRRFPARVDEWLISRHQPFDMYGDQSVSFCRTCRTEWPCDELKRAMREGT